MPSKAILVAAAQQRLAAANRTLSVALGRAVTGDQDARMQAEDALQEIRTARAKLAALEDVVEAKR